MRMTTFVVGIIIVTLVMTSFGIILADANEKYSAEYNPDDMVAFEQMEAMNNLSRGIQERVENQTTDRSVADVIGGFIADGKDTLLLAANSYGMFESMASEGLDKTPLPGIFKIALFSIMIVVVFIGIILAAILGRNL